MTERQPTEKPQQSPASQQPQPTHNRTWLRAYDVMREQKQKKISADS